MHFKWGRLCHWKCKCSPWSQCKVQFLCSQHITGAAAFISIPLNTPQPLFQAHNYFQHSASVSKVELFHLLFLWPVTVNVAYCSRECVWVCACVCAQRLRLWRRRFYRNTELSHLQPHHKSNCNSQINCSVSIEGPRRLCHTRLWCARMLVCTNMHACVCVCSCRWDITKWGHFVTWGHNTLCTPKGSVQGQRSGVRVIWSLLILKTKGLQFRK